MKFIFILIIVVFASCGEDTQVNIDENEIKSSSEPVEETEIIEDSLVYPYSVDGYSDTLVPFSRKEFVQSNFTENQIKDGIFYLYHYNQLPLFDVENQKDTVAYVGIGERLKIISILEEPYQDDTEFPGYWGIVKNDDGVDGNIPTNFLLKLPPPSKGDYGLAGYCLKHLHLVDSVYSSGEFYGKYEMGYEMEYSTSSYIFENGITLVTNSSYEASSTSMYLPNNTILEGFIFLDALLSDDNLFEYLENKLPRKSFTKSIKKNNGETGEFECKVDKNGNINRFYFIFGDGCFNDYTIKKEKTGITIQTSGGC